MRFNYIKRTCGSHRNKNINKTVNIQINFNLTVKKFNNIIPIKHMYINISYTFMYIHIKIINSILTFKDYIVL